MGTILIFLNTIVEKTYPEPWNYSFESISCSKSPVYSPQSLQYKFLDWKWPIPPSELFKKNIRFGSANLLLWGWIQNVLDFQVGTQQDEDISLLIYIWLFTSQVGEWMQWVVEMGGICYIHQAARPQNAPSLNTKYGNIKDKICKNIN